MINQVLYNHLEAIIATRGLKLYDIELLKENDSTLLRISLFKKGGVSLDDCESISMLIAPILDVELQELQNYHLEVSSPGIERTLKTSTHFLCSIGEKIEIRFHDKTTLKAILLDYKDDKIEIAPLQKTKDNKKHRIHNGVTQVQNKTNNTNKESTSSQTLITHNITQFINLKDCKKIKTFFDWGDYTFQN